MKAKLIDPAWDGNKVPASQQCDRFGGKGSTPVIHISGMPQGTEVVVLEFSDRDFSRMNNGGHGKIAMLVDVGALEVTFPSVPGHTFDLPPNIILVMAHKSPGWATAGAYMPPCSGGSRHHYDVEVIAAAIVDLEGKDFDKIESVIVPMGRY